MRALGYMTPVKETSLYGGKLGLGGPRAKAKDQETCLLSSCFVTSLGRGKRSKVCHLPLSLL